MISKHGLTVDVCQLMSRYFICILFLMMFKKINQGMVRNLLRHPLLYQGDRCLSKWKILPNKKYG